MKCIIIDDEPLAIDIIESYCKAIGGVDLIATFTNAIEALDFINNNNIDLVFSDIEMPNISGIELIKALEGKVPYFIFTTAYPQYALEGFDLNAADYLVKPIPFPRFIKAVNRVKEMIKLNQTNTFVNFSSAGGETTVQEDDFIFVKSEYENLKIDIKEIKYIQGLKDYLKIHSEKSKPILTLMSFKEIQSKLPENTFIRVHRSYIVNVNKITSIQKNRIIIKDERIAIGESYKHLVYSRLKI
ncbi:LytTR family DNA-binding domain-containing protein [Lacinutrix sp. C3R15]|uniref:LytR/AlgR family response regulator transcription factor n=1 Tax=Flavobacteriaceae TaxID=49546 RepID=UPI001C086128|nr:MULTISPECIES: LytTR family DNA-binding domain-containing protein [Flavobacteriaceae]MBU2938507.1 LytTR family DNA-binding domain-containing protein [Lacinutrix sp. C3R15]MDO6621821.1 LytTR family DNA-binding domain-containing protein [Oceanihabitans sp. 1_MG-2023]